MNPFHSLVLALVLALCLALSAAATIDSNATSGDNTAPQELSNSSSTEAAADHASTSIVSASASASAKCPSVCPLNYDPVCDTSGKVYGNACQFSIAQCKDSRLQLGTCPPPKCPSACPRIYKPVCDTSGKVYNNACLFSIAQCLDPRLQLGKCASSPKSLEAASTECPNACSEIYKPVCDTSNKIYHNACEFSIAQCKNPRLQLGTCVSTSVCASVLCRQFTECRVDDRTGRGYCADVCSPQRCASDETCVLQTVQCFTTPCPPIATCVKKA